MRNRDLIKLFSIEFSDCVFFNVYFVLSQQLIFIRCPAGKVLVRDLEGIGNGMHFHVHGYLLNRNYQKLHNEPRNYKDSRKVTGLNSSHHYLHFVFEDNTTLVCTFSNFGKLLTIIDGQLVIVNSIRNLGIDQQLSLKYYQIDSMKFQRIGESLEKELGILKEIHLSNSLF